MKGASLKEMALILESFHRIFGKEKPLAKLLSTPAGYYLYDSGTNKVLECSRGVYLLLNSLFFKYFPESVEEYVAEHGENSFLNASRQIIEAVEHEKILSAKKATQFGLSDHFRDLKRVLKSSVMGINLEVTQDCNLRCVYCIYQDHYLEKRNYSSKEMSTDIACKAIRFLKEHSSENNYVSIGFYGGEPLMKFPLIKECVRYAKEVFPSNQKLRFNITTNATLVNHDIAEYLMNQGFSVTISLDGPEEFHDRFRIDKKGSGSFVKTLNGLKLLSENYHRVEKRGRLLINVVYTPPFNRQKLDTIEKYFRGLKWLPKDIIITSTYPSDNSIPSRYVRQEEIEEDMQLFEWAFENYSTDFQQSHPIVKGQIEERFAKFIKRPVLTEPADGYMLNGCCVPGQKKNYITADGYIQICEKMPGNCPPIGHVETGFDYETIEKIYIQEYAAKSLPFCCRCWALRLCDVCYLSAFNNKGQLDMDKKNRCCHSVMKHIEQSLCHFVTVLGKNSGKVDYLHDFELK